MKRIILFILLITVGINSFAQEAKLNIKSLNAKNNTVVIQIPVDGAWFYPAKKEIKFDADSTVNYSLKINKIAWLRINNNTVLIEPGTTRLVFDKGILVHSNKNNEGMLLFNKRNTEFYQYRARDYYKKDSTTAGLYQLLENDKNEAVKPYTELFSKQKISANFYNEIKRYFSTEEVILEAAIPMIILSTKQKINSDLDKMWADAYKKHPINNVKDAFYPDFYHHARYYASTYLHYYLPLKKGKKPLEKSEDENLKNCYKSFEDNFSGKTKEYLLATFLYDEMLQSKYQRILVDLFTSFKSSYPKSNFSPFLQPFADKILAYQKDIKKDYKANEKFVANYYEINSLDSLMNRFKGKTVFVDIWATWCGPCKAEFEYSAGLEKFLQAKGVEMLFISMDKDVADQRWKEMIKYYKLSGSHIRTNNALQKDLIDRLWEGKGYAIPRYLIIKDGKLVVADALRPSDKEKLYAQISKFL
ncbi:thiol-disulfide isomerase/thioredoxin [Pedobacter sp. AK013]|uniref:TlpA family protein disulfide reductase n=1 Tax=Pedobacter sp. AK013 TaxID=2723071 RepID=UPI0016099C56|nr:TlpA disulfide reductase family protein [Pedobacter sp. AK013]MBB6238408.1 thiol-disulfide isomerase/thioredoxin [Pedobacter sp. AK013]